MNHISIIYRCNPYTYLSLCHMLNKTHYHYENINNSQQLRHVLDKNHLLAKKLFCDVTDLIKLNNDIISRIETIYCFVPNSFPSIFLRLQGKIIIISKTCTVDKLHSLNAEKEYFQHHGIDIILSLDERRALKLWKEGCSPQITANIMNKSVKSVYRYRNALALKYGFHKAMSLFIISLIAFLDKKIQR